MKPDRDLSTAFQPIVSATKHGVIVFGYEALARRADGTVPPIFMQSRASERLYAFDYRCRKVALFNAAALALRGNLSLNITPGAVCHPRYGVDATVRVANEVGFPVDRIIFEITEREPVPDYGPIRECIDRYRAQGARLALDDFGTGFNGLNTLLDMRPDIVKVDMKLVRKIETDADRQALMFGICSGGDRLGMRLIAEGVETIEGLTTLSAGNIDLMQGYFFAKPSTGALPAISDDVVTRVVTALDALPRSAEIGDMRGAEPAAFPLNCV